MSKKKLAVVIGRFQPFHNQHLYLVEEALKQAEKVLIVVGSINQPRTPKNPYTFEERKCMLRYALIGSKDSVSVVGVEDYVHDSDWKQSVQDIVSSDSNDIVLVGHSKDESSYYLNLFPEWDFKEVAAVEDLSSTDIRDEWFLDEGISTDVPCNVANFMDNTMFTKSWFGEVQTQAVHNKRELDKLTKGYPYPKSLNVCAADALVSCYGKHLLIKRKENPYKGCWALAGGHKDSNETFLQCALRELEEETSLALTEDDMLQDKMFDKPKRDPVCTKVSMCHWFGIPNFKYENGSLPEVTPKDDAVEAKWFTTDELVDMKGEIAFDHYEMLTHFLDL